MKVDSLRLQLASCFVKTANEKEKEVKNTCMKSEKNKEWHKMRRNLYSLTEALGRSPELPVNSQVCRLHWDEIRRHNNQCTCPMAKHSRGLHPNAIPPRFYRVFDSVGSHFFAVSARSSARHSAIIVDTRVRNSRMRSHFAVVNKKLQSV